MVWLLEELVHSIPSDIDVYVMYDYSVVTYKKPVYIVVFCMEAMKRCGITLATP